MLGLAATAAVRAKLHYRRGLALRGLGRSGAREAFTAASRCSFMKEVASEALAHEVGGGACDLTAVPCVRKLADAYFDRIARVGNTAASSVCRSQDSHNCTDEIFAAARGGDSSATLDVLFAGVGDIRNALATLVDLRAWLRAHVDLSRNSRAYMMRLEGTRALDEQELLLQL